MKKILIVEDELPIAELEKDYLELSDFEVTIETDGIEGEAKAMSGEYDLLILDVMLPGQDGFEICRKYRESIWHLSLLFRQKRKILIKSMD